MLTSLSVSEHLSTRAVTHSRSVVRHPLHVSSRKWRPSGRSSNRRATYTSDRWIQSVPVNGGDFEGRGTVTSISLVSIELLIIVRFSRRDREQIRSKTAANGRSGHIMRRDLTTCENP